MGTDECPRSRSSDRWPDGCNGESERVDPCDPQHGRSGRDGRAVVESIRARVLNRARLSWLSRSSTPFFKTDVRSSHHSAYFCTRKHAITPDSSRSMLMAVAGMPASRNIGSRNLSDGIAQPGKESVVVETE